MLEDKNGIELAVILAAGMGTRLNSKFGDIPKGFITVDGTELISRSYKLLRKAGIKNVIIGTGYKAQYYNSFSEGKNITCINNDMFKESSSFYTLLNMQDVIDKSFLLLESDILYDSRAVKHLLDSTLSDIVLLSGQTNSGDEVYVEAGENNALINLSKNPHNLDHITGELVGISKVSFDTYKSMCLWGESNPDEAKSIDYEEVLVKISELNKIKVEKINDLIWCEIDDEAHYERAVKEILPRINEDNIDFETD